MSVAENSKFIALVPDNGTEFIAEQKAIFTINPDIGFIKGRDSYISYDILNTDSNSRINVLHNTAGANAVIDRMDIFSLQNGQLMESLTNYNLWASIQNQYCEEDDTHTQLKQNTGVKCRSYDVSQNSTSKVNTLNEIGTAQNPRVPTDVGATSLSVISSGSQTFSGTYADATDHDPEMGVKKFTSRKMCIPIRSGIFSAFGVSEKLTPVLLFGGLKIEITFAKNEHVLVRPYTPNDANGAVKQASDFATGIDVDAQAGGSAIITLTNDINDPSELGITRGSVMNLRGGAGAGAAGQKFTVSHLHRGDGGSGDPNKKIVIVATGNLTAVNTNNKIWFEESTPSYKIKNMELKVLQVIPPRAMMKTLIKESQFDFISWDCFLDNLPQTSRSHQSDIHSVASGAKCIMTHYISVATENDIYAPNYYAGQPPHNTFLNSVQYFINNKLYPLKAYNPQAKQDKVVNLNEVVKAFQTIGLDVKRLGDGRGGNLCDYTNTYLHARELARGEQFVYNLKDAEPQIRLGFTQGRDEVPAGTDAVAKGNCRIVNFVWSIKTIMVKKDNLQLLL